MVSRLILFLLLALTSTPMPAAACDSAMPVAVNGHSMTGMDHPVPMPSSHDCIGCVAVADWDGARIAPPVLIVAPPLAARVAAMPLLPGQAPTPPPPRNA